MEDLGMSSNFWQDKKIFLTGHTGFKGAWMSLWLHHLGAKVKGYALAPTTPFSLFELIGLAQFIESHIADVNDYQQLCASMEVYSPEIVFHFAAQAFVPASYQKPLETLMTNAMGTTHVLEAARKIPSIRAVVIITTDKCYENKEWVWPYRENDALGGVDPYSASKACAELVTAAYRQSFFDENKVGIATARAGNVIGGGDFSIGRLIPDFIQSVQLNKPIYLRYPNAVRPWQHVLDPLNGYLLLAEELYNHPSQFSEAWNFGPDSQAIKTVSQVVEQLITISGKGSWERDTGNHPHESHDLKLDIHKAKERLGWQPVLTIDEALERTNGWYDAWRRKENMLALTIDQLNDFIRRK